MDKLLACLRQFDALRDVAADGGADTVLTRVVPGYPPQLVPDDYLSSLPAAVRTALASLGIEGLYTRQAEAIDRIRAGDDVVLESPTASGKTLCFNIPMALTPVEEPRSHALVVHPMKALPNDQRRQF